MITSTATILLIPLLAKLARQAVSMWLLLASAGVLAGSALLHIDIVAGEMQSTLSPPKFARLVVIAAWYDDNISLSWRKDAYERRSQAKQGCQASQACAWTIDTTLSSAEWSPAWGGHVFGFAWGDIFLAISIFLTAWRVSAWC